MTTSTVDVIARKGQLDHYQFLSTTGTLTITGFFVNEFGWRTGTSFTNTVTTSEAKNFADLYGATLPRDAVGFRGTFNVAAYYDLGPAVADESDFESNPTRYPQIPASNDVHIGRVAL